MAVSITHLGYRKLSQMIFEWQAADRTALLAVFMAMEVLLHWLWCLFVWWQQDALNTHVDITLLYPLWLGITVMGVFFLAIIRHLTYFRNDDDTLYKWQILLMFPYTLYIAIVIVMMGYSSLFAGVSLVGGAMLGMVLIKRRYVWRVFLLQIVMIFLAIISPYFGIQLPNLRQFTAIHPLLGISSHLTYNEVMAIENAVAVSIFKSGTFDWNSVRDLHHSSVFFWRSTHVLLALPKAVFIVYMFRTLLLILDDSKKEILHHANQDELTQLKSRRYGLAQMQQSLLALQEEQDLSIVLLDLDWFKGINDNYGHDVGDQVLVEIAQILSQSLTEDAIVSRYGGEEFLIVLPNTAHDSAMVITQQLRRSIAEHIIDVDDETCFQVTASFGLYTLTHDEQTRIKQAHKILAKQTASTQSVKPKTRQSHSKKRVDHQIAAADLPNDICQRLISTADKALYEAKNRGRNQVVSANEMSSANSQVASLYGT